MKIDALPIFAALVVAFGAAFWAGCTPDFEVDDDPTLFACEEDDDCLDHYVCNVEAGHCDVPEDDENDNDNNDNDEFEGPCDPDADEDELPDEPLDVVEQCDGLDTNCDGTVDDMSCETDDDCPRSGEDIYGTSLSIECDDGRCVGAVPEDEIACSGFECLPGEGGFESAYEDEFCPLGNAPPENHQDNDGEDNDGEDNDGEDNDGEDNDGEDNDGEDNDGEDNDGEDNDDTEGDDEEE